MKKERLQYGHLDIGAGCIIILGVIVLSFHDRFIEFVFGIFFILIGIIKQFSVK